jgi:hypothetical protein
MEPNDSIIASKAIITCKPANDFDSWNISTSLYSTVCKQGQISCSTNQRICLHFRSQLFIMQETRNLHQGELENIAVFSGFREIQF